MRTPSKLAGPSVAVASIGLALALAACGSSGRPATLASSDRYASLLKFSECMRSHGVPSFPDPTPGSGGGIRLAGISPEVPAFQQAQQSCKRLLPGGGPPATVPESVKLSLLKHAECMRSHGVPNYPDPTFPKGGGVETFIGSGVDANSPAFQAAAKACGGHG